MKGIRGLALKERLALQSKEAENGCIEWTGYIMETGYAQIKFQDKAIYVHRASWMVNKGPIPDGKLVCHHCDNKKCVNPDHLFIGTQYDNMQDMIKKGRKVAVGRKGSKHHRTHLVEDDVIRIRKLYKETDITREELAKIYDISKTAMQGILTGRTWKHLERI